MTQLTLQIPIPDGALSAVLSVLRGVAGILRGLTSPAIQSDSGARAFACNLEHAVNGAIGDVSQALADESAKLTATTTTAASVSAGS